MRPHLSRLLVWLDELDELQPGHYVRVSSFVEMEELPVADGRVLALQLEKRGFVRSGRSYGMGNDPRSY